MCMKSVDSVLLSNHINPADTISQHNTIPHHLINSMSMYTSLHCLLVSLDRDYSYTNGNAK